MSLTRQSEEFSWEQKHRPDHLDGVILPVAMRSELNKYVELKQMPHLLLISPSPGTGKTTTAIALAHGIGCVRPFIVNASKDTDIGTIRTRVTQYATGASLINRQRKVVILDEVDRISTQAQEALKGIMEDVSHICSFVLTTNHPARITEQLQSRCTPLNFTFTQDDRKTCAIQMAKLSTDILDKEGVTYDKRVVAQIVMKCAPDYRRVVKLLQQMYTRYGEIGPAALGELRQADLAPLIASMKTKNYGEVLKWSTANFDQVGSGFYRQIYDALRTEITPQSVAALIIMLGEEQKAHSTVPDLFVHITRVLTLVMSDVEFTG